MKKATLREKYLNFMCTLNCFLLLRKSIVGLQETILKTTFASDSAAVKRKKQKTKLKIFYTAAQNNGFRNYPLY